MYIKSSKKKLFELSSERITQEQTFVLAKTLFCPFSLFVSFYTFSQFFATPKQSILFFMTILNKKHILHKDVQRHVCNEIKKRIYTRSFKAFCYNYSEKFSLVNYCRQKQSTQNIFCKAKDKFLAKNIPRSPISLPHKSDYLLCSFEFPLFLPTFFLKKTFRLNCYSSISNYYLDFRKNMKNLFIKCLRQVSIKLLLNFI